MQNHKIRAKISNKFTRTAQAHIKKGDLVNYSEDGIYIYKQIPQEEYVRYVNGEKVMMDELGIEAEIVI